MPPITRMGDILPQKSGNDFFGVAYAAKHSLRVIDGLSVSYH